MMNHAIIWLAAPIGILSTAVIFGTDVFFLTIGRAALRRASVPALTEVMGFFHLFADARMPAWGIAAILSNLLLAFLSRSAGRWLYLASFSMLVLFVIVYTRTSKPINQTQSEAAVSGKSLVNGRELQDSWDRLLFIRVPLLTASLLAQCLVLTASA
ncbi:DUF1772 domain-containing protein [Acidobacteria bacterium AB60]|nr:DUF1772 domain-containing protein [Acidobacteria bacterium AB60]